jgi:hypothetical protein
MSHAIIDDAIDGFDPDADGWSYEENLDLFLLRQGRDIAVIDARRRVAARQIADDFDGCAVLPSYADAA